jgi:iron-sulfur cluster assembly protein
VRDGLKQLFKFDNPNVEATCGCGESFSFKGAATAKS